MCSVPVTWPGPLAGEALCPRALRAGGFIRRLFEQLQDSCAVSPSLPPVPRPRAPAAGSPLRRAEPPVCHTRGALGLKTCSAWERSRLLPEMEAKAGEEADALPEASPQEQACSVTCGEGAVRYRLSLSRSSAACGPAALNTCDHSCPKFLIVPNNNCPREAPTPRARPPALAHVALVSVFVGLPPGIFKM